MRWIPKLKLCNIVTKPRESNGSQGFLQARFGGRLPPPPPKKKKISYSPPQIFTDFIFIHPEPPTPRLLPPPPPKGEILQETLGSDNNRCDGKTCLWTATFLPVAALEQRQTETEVLWDRRLGPNFTRISVCNIKTNFGYFAKNCLRLIIGFSLYPKNDGVWWLWMVHD